MEVPPLWSSRHAGRMSNQNSSLYSIRTHRFFFVTIPPYTPWSMKSLNRSSSNAIGSTSSDRKNVQPEFVLVFDSHTPVLLRDHPAVHAVVDEELEQVVQ